ncbi:MAG TPA: beta-ketoacyl synthase N-terminal-like domain-containing protein [Candidatus Polarisedimenticolaceae bacterium]|nr:beta-ketoacyl synthase N-terminal-like domain-containing protein [Candidatus Polarisedimenticolaceae bacterium]
MTPAVAITGFGFVGASGCGAEAAATAVARGEPVVRAIDHSAGYLPPGAPRMAALVDGDGLAAHLPPGRARRMSPPARFAVAAARMAVAQAGLAEVEEGGGPAAVVLATTFGPASYTERLCRQIFLEGPEAASPSVFTECVASAAASQVAIACGAHGVNLTVAQREAGPVTAVLRAADEVASGRARRALAGSVDEMTPLLHAALAQLRALGEPCRPFDRARAGTLAGEGATVLLLERAEEARARGARVLATVEAGVRAFDPTAGRAGWGRGGGALAAKLAARIPPRSVDAVVSGASGARAGDALEATVLRTWRSDLPPVLVPKAVLGEYGGSLLAGALLAAQGRPFGPTPHFRESDEGGVVPHDGRALAPPDRVLVTALAAGGAAAWMVLGAGRA